MKVRWKIGMHILGETTWGLLSLGEKPALSECFFLLKVLVCLFYECVQQILTNAFIESHFEVSP